MHRKPSLPKQSATVAAWRVPTVWLVVGGPLTVVIASIVTAVVAWRGADPVLDIHAQARQEAGSQAALPALQARNHAATGGRP